MIGAWTPPRIAEATRPAYAAYLARREEQVRTYFSRRPQLASRSPLMARDARRALPEGLGQLEDRIPPRARHRWWLSGKSSQMLALGVLGGSETADPKLGWLAELAGASIEAPTTQFEYSLAPDMLGEHPRTTTIDYAVLGRDLVICLEAKWTEAGMGTCSCGPERIGVGACLPRVCARTTYWQTAAELGLPDRVDGTTCALATGYQAVRLVAAARALADAAYPNRRAVALVVYDSENPYFAGHGAWPGWAHLIPGAQHPDVRVVAASWQEVVSQLPLDAPTRLWCQEKYGLLA